MERIKQGDAYSLPVEIKMGGEPISILDISRIEFVIGGYRKFYPGGVTYSQEEGVFYVPLTQEETFSWEVGPVFLDIRVQFAGGDVEGIDIPIPIVVNDAVSEVVL